MLGIHTQVISSVTGGPAPAKTSFASAVWPSANLAIYCPLILAKSILVKILFLANGAAVSGNVDLGIYDHAGTRITSTGSTAQSGVNAPQIFNITDVLIGPGLFYLALAINNTTAAVSRASFGSAAEMKLIGLLQEASAFPLPANATFATITNDYLPVIGLARKPLL